MEEKKNTMENTAEKLTKLFEKHNREFRFDPQVSHRWIVNAFDEYTKFSLYKDHPTTDSGSVAAPKPDTKSECPKCGSYNIIMFTSDDDLCQNCEHTFPGVLGSRLKTAPPKEEYKLDDAFVRMMDKALIDTLSKQLESLRQQLEQREEALKELLPIAEKTFDSMARHEIIYAPVKMDKVEVAEIIDKARKLLGK